MTRFGRLDVVVNNAGRFLLKPIVDTTDDEWDGLMTTNVRSVFVHCREALPHLIAARAGSIVNVSSISGVIGLPAQGAYCATKGAIGQMASPEEIARVMVFLASPQSSFMTGAVVMADGGFTAR
jgi:NAD(P)-dependent dehydrogenase (short-subunit alcohol dehydrogenase family)